MLQMQVKVVENINTPQEVSELLTKLTLVGKTEVNKVYDPACGSVHYF